MYTENTIFIVIMAVIYGVGALIVLSYMSKTSNNGEKEKISDELVKYRGATDIKITFAGASLDMMRPAIYKSHKNMYDIEYVNPLGMKVKARCSITYTISGLTVTWLDR